MDINKQDAEEMELGLETAIGDERMIREKLGPNATEEEVWAEFDRMTDIRYEVMRAVSEIEP